MKKLFFFLAFALIASTVSVSQHYETTTNQYATVYVCTGGYATKYHCTKDCRGLGNCKGEIVSMVENEAVSQGRSKCGICW